ncbi:MAG TPA: ISNCY family transposase, partial [Herpetosiphonaceae bacterium]|nr:ISNCY family transposase [Herpetosiphonaceae bacterium]
TEQWVSDSLVLRQFCRVYAMRVPDATTLIRWATLIQPATLQQLLEHVVELARQNRVTRGRKLRLDSTVVATTIHYPVDSTLLADGARVLTRTIQRAKAILTPSVARGRTIFRNRLGTVRRVTKQLIDATRRRGEAATEQVREGYQQLVRVTQQVVEQAQQVQHQLQTQLQQQRDRSAQRLLDTLETFVPQVEQVISQTTRRVLQGETVPASEKVVSLFEPHTAIIRKGKAGKPTEFGRVLWVAETEGGIITQARVLEGNPDDAAELVPSLDQHIAQFTRPPRLLAGDGKLATATNEREAQQRGVRHVVLPRPGKKTASRMAYERQGWFRRGRNWRAGIEGRISGLKRGHGLEQCRYHGDAGMKRWVGWGVIAHNLRVIAEHRAAQATR